MSNPVHFEKTLSSETLFEGRVITLTKDTALLENGRTATREVVHHHGGACIVPYFADGTICMGMAASMGAFLLASGTKGKRFALPNAEIMIHQPLIAGGQGGGLSGQATDIKIHADHLVRTRAKMNRLLSEYTGQPLEKVEQDTERDNFLSAQEAKEYGLIDEVITHR